MTKQNENRVVDICNAVSVRSEADSNRCIRFCRPLPSHSAIRPFVLSCRPPLDSLICKRLHRLSRVRSSLTLLPVPHALSTSNISHSLNLRPLALRLKSLALSQLQVPRSPLHRAPRVGAEHGVGDVRPANIQKNIYLPKLRQIFDSFSEKYYFYSTVDAPATTQPHPRIRPVRLRGDTVTAHMPADTYVTTPYKYGCDATCGRLYETAANV